MGIIKHGQDEPFPKPPTPPFYQALDDNIWILNF